MHQSTQFVDKICWMQKTQRKYTLRMEVIVTATYSNKSTSTKISSLNLETLIIVGIWFAKNHFHFKFTRQENYISYCKWNRALWLFKIIYFSVISPMNWLRIFGGIFRIRVSNVQWTPVVEVCYYVLHLSPLNSHS